jgi:CRISPR-associated exonuclease Cas4
VRGLPIRSLRLGLSGKADVVEFSIRPPGPPLPVEYKRGRPKSEHWDEIQLCAQALCLEEMLSVSVPCGALYYGEPRRRLDITFDNSLRQETEELARRMHHLYDERRTPPPRLTPRCKHCSLHEICEPEMLERRGSASVFFRRSLQSNLRGHETE